jgi:N-sulfoglucosamine sulfohydrolase
MDRRTLLSAGLAAPAVLSAGVDGSAAVADTASTQKSRRATRGNAMKARRSVLLIIADDQGYDLGCCGAELTRQSTVKTPVLDRLGGEGTLFTQGYATVSSCSSSRSTLYTGLYSHTNGMYGLAHPPNNQSLLDEVKTLPWMLKQAGYATALVGKKHVRPDELLPYDAWLAPEQPGNRNVAFMAHEAGRFLRAQEGKPFFLTVGYSDPHRAAVNFGNTQDWPEIKRVRYAPNDVVIPAHLPDLPEIRADLAQYYESVSRLDGGIGILLDQLKAAKREDDTLVIYLSDNGRAFPGAKTTLYDEGIHLPLIIRSPERTRRGVRCDAMVSWIDIAPTILDWAGAPPPPGYAFGALPGRSLLPLLEQEHAPGWDRVFASHNLHEINQYYPMRAIRTRRHHYIANLAPELTYPTAGDIEQSPSWAAIQATAGAKLGCRTLDAYLHRPPEELYDVASDPCEVVNLAGDAAHKAVLEDLRNQLTQWRAATRDPWLPGQTSPFAAHAPGHG